MKQSTKLMKGYIMAAMLSAKSFCCVATPLRPNLSAAFTTIQTTCSCSSYLHKCIKHYHNSLSVHARLLFESYCEAITSPINSTQYCTSALSIMSSCTAFARQSLTYKTVCCSSGLLDSVLVIPLIAVATNTICSNKRLVSGFVQTRSWLKTAA